MRHLRHLTPILAATLLLTACMGTEPDPPKPRLSAVGPAGTAFGATLLNTRKQLDFTLSNSDAGLPAVETLKNIAISVSGTSLAVSHTCPTELDEGESCFISVVYTPQSAGTLTGEIRVTSNAEGSPLTRSISGSAVATLNPAAGVVRFDDTPLVTTFAASVGNSQSRTYTVRNIGNADDTLTLTGPTQDGWTWSHTCTAALAPDATCTVTVRFEPTERGPSIPEPVVVSDAYNKDYGGLTLRLSGTGQ